MTSATLRVGSLEELAVVAAAVARTLPARGFVGLEGDLGAGKTAFVQAVARAAGLPDGEVVSPTFGLIHVHPLPPSHPAGALVHADLYRLTGIDELHELGWDDATAGEAWVFVEWPGRAAAALPPERIDVLIEVESPTARRITVTSRGPRHDAVVAGMLSACDSTRPPRSSA
jgi:tRNA threonylcarbamoyl adenosine modification protein YjeE